jgi:hypothetical protein
MSAAAIGAWSQSEWRRAATLCDFATALFRERSADIAWEIGTLEMMFNLPALFFLGELPEVARRAPAALADAEARDDRYAATTLRGNVMPLVHLSADRPDEARRELARGRAAWTAAGFHLQHWALLLGETLVAIYEGELAAARAALDAAWPSLEGSYLLRQQNVRIRATALRGQLALAAGDLRAARAASAALGGEAAPFAGALALALRAGIAARSGEPAAARARCGEAAAAFAALGMELFAAASRRRAAELAAAEDEIAAADATLTAAGVVCPRRFAALLAPDVGV